MSYPALTPCPPLQLGWLPAHSLDLAVTPTSGPSPSPIPLPYLVWLSTQMKPHQIGPAPPFLPQIIEPPLFLFTLLFLYRKYNIVFCLLLLFSSCLIQLVHMLHDKLFPPIFTALSPRPRMCLANKWKLNKYLLKIEVQSKHLKYWTKRGFQSPNEA